MIDTVEGLKEKLIDGKFTIKGEGRPEVTVAVTGIVETTKRAYLAIADNSGVCFAWINDDSSVYGLMAVLPSLEERLIKKYNEYHSEKIVKIHKV